MKREAEQLGTTVDQLKRELAAERPLPVVIMAYGKQERLSGVLDYPKHFLLLDDAPFGTLQNTILDRTVRQLRDELGVTYLTICAPLDSPGYPKLAHNYACTIGAVDADEQGLITNMARATLAEFRKHDVLFLLGDVVWDPEDLRRVVLDRHPGPLFYGRYRNPFTQKEHGELFALKMRPRELEAFADAKTLWDLHARIGGHTPLRLMNGYTDDVDTQEDIELRLPILRRLVAEELL